MAEIVQASFTEGCSGNKTEKQPVTAKYNVNSNQQSPTMDLSQDLHGSSLHQDVGVQRHIRGIDDKTQDDEPHTQA